MNRALAPLVGLLLLPAALPAQGAMIAPHAVVIDDRARAGTITLHNPGSQAIEVSIDLVFGYVVTDSVGEFAIRYEGDSTTPSASPWLTAYPRRFNLPPLARQTVRVLARPPQALPGGEYWARMMVTTREGSVPARARDTTAIRVGLALEVRTILPVYYRKGAMSTGLALMAPTIAREGDSLAVRIPMRRTGIAAYIGQSRLELVGPDGRTVARGTFPLAVFQDANPRMILGVQGLAPGRYRLRVENRTERPGSESATMVQAPPIRAEFDVFL